MAEVGGATGVTPDGPLTGQGRLVGRRYRLLSPVGRGGMGVVWHAHDVLLDRDVAVKELILPYGLDDTGRQASHRRMLREARSAARLGHPGIITVHDVVEEDGRPWIVMELVRAWSLEQAIRQNGPLPPVQAAEIGIRVLEALRHAHAAGILHRDVKPGNVLLTNDRVVLTDFGIAAIEGDLAITQTGLLMGSPAYIPPERLQGRPITHAADLWSFGATLYTAVEGRPPYEGPDAVAVLGAVLTREPNRPQRAGPLLPVIDGLLRKNPADRLSAEQVADRLMQVLRAHGSMLPGHSAYRQEAAPMPAPVDSSAQSLPPFDMPSGPFPSRIIETPSGPVRVPYDPSADLSSGYPGLGHDRSGPHRAGPPAAHTGPAAFGGPALGASGPHRPPSPEPPPASPRSGSQTGPQTGPGRRPRRARRGDTRRGDGPHRDGTHETETYGDETRDGARAPSSALWPTSDTAGRTQSRHQRPDAEEDTARDGRRRGLLLGLAGIATVGVVAGVVLLARPGDTGSGDAGATGPVAAVSTAAASPAASKPTGNGTPGEAPSGYRMRTVAGVRLAVPESWTAATTASAGTFSGPKGSGLHIQVKRAVPAASDGGLGALTKDEAGSTFSDYLQIRLARATFRDWPASDWEYTYTNLNDVSTHVLTRHVTIDSKHAYQVSVVAPDAQWDKYQNVRTVLWNTFGPAS